MYFIYTRNYTQNYTIVGFYEQLLCTIWIFYLYKELYMELYQLCTLYSNFLGLRKTLTNSFKEPLAFIYYLLLIHCI